ncbi:MAG: hypothetical protein COB84_08990 [Rhodobacteraceae bacterium]|nr:MAG: hypothetical protein COB84_08990 [Paracoccaceae bacterium]
MTHPIIDTVKTQDVIVFDGVCALCNGSMKFILRFDRQKHYKFITAQSATGQALYKHYNLDPTNFDTFLVFKSGDLLEKMDGVLAIATTLGWPWKIAAIGYLIPRPIRNWFYMKLAKNRYKIFGKYDTCMIPTQDVKERFLD